MTGITERLRLRLADRYRIERELGAGGMATVYLAEDVKHRRRVALKVLRPELSAVLGVERFLKEIEVTANLQHPHLLPLFDSGEGDGLLFYVMPYIEGESLRAKLEREHQLSIDEALRIATQVSGALDYAHRHGVVHRDIKPENILLHEGQALVADFGIALAVREAGGDRLTQTGLSLGTPHYMSPEQAAGDVALERRTDIYSLACVLYEMLAGQPPHTGSTVQAVIARLLTDKPRRVTDLRSSVPEHVADALEVALAKVPADRFDSAGAFAEALTHPSAPQARREAHSVATRPRIASPGALAMVALAGLAGWGWAGRLGPEADTRVQRIPIALNDPPRSRSTWAKGVELSPSGDQLAYYTEAGWQILDLSTGLAQAVSREIRGLGLTFSPSGDSVALSTTGRLQQIYVADLATGRAALVADCCLQPWGWDEGGWIYHADILGNFVRTNLDGGREVLEPPAEGESWGVWNGAKVPGGRQVLFVRYPPGTNDPSLAEVMAKDLDSGRVRPLSRGVYALVSSAMDLLIVRSDGALVASRWDPESLSISGTPVVVLENLEVKRGSMGLIAASVSLADDGTLVYVERGEVVEDTVVVVDRAGRATEVTSTWGGWVNDVARSADGTRWATSVHRGLATPNVWARSAGGQERRLTYSDNLDYDPRFMPPDNALTFIGSTRGRNWDLYRVPFQGGGEPELLLDREGDIQNPRFTSDGRWVVFCDRAISGQTDILGHRLGQDSLTVALVATPAYDCYPDVSPDGRWLAYQSNETSAAEVYVRPFDVNASGRWQVTQGGTIPRWSSDGDELFYLNARREVVAVPVTTSPGFGFGEPRMLFALDQRTDWTGEVLPGGEGFILIRRRREAPGQVIMIRNFDELLRERLGS